MARRPVWLTDQEVALLFALVTGQSPVGGSHVGTAAALARLAEPWLTITDDGTVVRLVPQDLVRPGACGGAVETMTLYRPVPANETGEG